MSVENWLPGSKYLQASPQEIHELYQQSRSRIAKGVSGPKAYDLLQLHFHLALITGDDTGAKVALQRIRDRFGETSTVVGVLQSQYIEMTQGVSEAQTYLSSRPTTDLLAFKRKTVILKRNGNWPLFVQELLKYLAIVPTDHEAWAELAEAYVNLNHYARAFFALEEVVIIYPQAYNMFSRAGEVAHIAGTVSSTTAEQLHWLKTSIDQFSRSVELNPAYVRGWSGIYVVTNKLVQFPKLNDKRYEQLKGVARKRLQELKAGASESDKAAIEGILVHEP